jgi:hypothetical protein
MYEETMARLHKIKDAGYRVVSNWACEYKKHLRNTSGLENELSSLPYVKNTPINIRYALYGYRIEASKTYYRVVEGEINYVDVISLYPYIRKYGKFPVGHPKVYVGGDCLLNVLSTEEIIK